MLVGKVVQFAALAAAAVLWDSTTDAATSTAVKFCGRKLGEIMSRVCHAYNSPWDVPTVVEQPGAPVRRRRQLGGIADECCIIGCTWEQLSEYCSISAYSESPLEELEAHIIADRSAEQDGVAGSGLRDGTGASAVAGATGATKTTAAVGAAAAAPAAVGSAGYTGVAGARREVGRARSRGYGRSRARARRCWCRRKRRSGRRRSSLMGPRKKCSTRCTRGGYRVTANNLGQNPQY